MTKNSKGAIEFGVSFIISIVIFLVITASAVFIFDNVAMADIKAQNSARNLGVAFDVLALTTKEVKMDATCPDGVFFTIEGSRISAKVFAAVGEGYATYHYLHEKNALLPVKKTIDCSGGGIVEVSKTYDKDTLKPVISVG